MNQDPTTRLKDRWFWALCATLALGLVFRLWGIDYGLPISYWTDEYHELMRAMQLGAGSFNFARTTKGGFYLLLFFEYGVYFVVLKALGVVGGTREFAELFVRDPTMFYLIGRSTAVLIGCITVAGVYWIARYAYSSLAGLVGALLLAVNVLHVDLSHRIGVDVPMAATAALALYFGLRLANEGGRRNYLWAAVFAALATTTKLPGILVLIPLLIAHAYAASSAQGGERGWFRSRDLWIALGVFVAILVATNPGVLGHLGISVDPSGSAVRLADPDELDDAADPATGLRPNLYFYYLQVLLDSMGWPLFLASLAAVGWAVIRRNRADVMLVSYAVANYLAIATTSSETLYYPRYALPIVVVMAILTGRLFADFVAALPRWRTAGAVAAFALLSVWPVWTIVVADHALTLTDTRTIAKEWFENNVPAGAKVLIEGGKTGPKRESVQLIESRSSLQSRIDYWKRVEPRQARYLEVKLATDDGSGYDLELVRQQSIATLEDYAAAGVEYFVVRPEYFAASRKAGSGAEQLLRDLRSDPRVTMLRRFVPLSPSYPGDTVEIYHLTQGNQASAK